MIFQPDALRRVVAFLDAHAIPYMVVGGIANAIWGRVRTTADVDLKVLTGERSVAELRRLVESEFGPYRRPGLGPAESPLIVSLEVPPGTVVDLLVGVFPYEEQAVARAVLVEFEGMAIRVCSPEDLIIHKAIADRPKDWGDIEGVIWRQKERLDLPYIRDWLRQWGDALEKPDLPARFDSLVAGLSSD
jgi:predicted nucleotidyltransferase